jgi:peptidoglycan/xylan/chitin deacetylase (PgdA/CDA1 family)
MTLGNHTFSHLNFNDVSLAQFEDEVIRGETVTRALMRGRGIDKFYLRFPFNHTGDTREKKEGLEIFLRERGYAIAPFTIEHSDYVYSRAYTKALLQSNEKLAERIRNDYLNFLDTSCDYFEQKSRDVLGYEPKQILLIHVNQLNAICLEEMVQRLKKRGYSFISLDEALKDKAYQTPDSYIGKFGLSWIFRWASTLNKKIDRSKEPDPPQFVMDLYSAN